MKIIETAGGFVRKSLRGATINYRWGWFFVSFNCAENKSVFGSIVGEEVALNELGKRVERAIAEMSRHYPEVYVDTFVVMPNHVHFIVKIENRPTNDENHLGKLVRKLKTFTATIYRKMKEADEITDFGIDGLWQTDFWEVIVTNHDQLEGYRKYIRENPKNWSRDRFGAVTTYSRGNLALLDTRFVAFVASEGDARAEFRRVWVRDGASGTRGTETAAAMPPTRGTETAAAAAPMRNTEIVAPMRNSETAEGKPPVISTFMSPSERMVLRRLLAGGRRVIAVYPGGIPFESELPRDLYAALLEGRALLISPAAPKTGLNKQRANWCNEYILRNSAEVWAGYVRQGGSLATMIAALAPSL